MHSTNETWRCRFTIPGHLESTIGTSADARRAQRKTEKPVSAHSTGQEDPNLAGMVASHQDPDAQLSNYALTHPLAGKVAISIWVC